jgi:hypothetical protein
MSTIVSIGRNVGDVPLSAGRWNAFKHEVRYLVENDAGPVVFAGEGLGIWESEVEDPETGDFHAVRMTETAATFIGEGTPQDAGTLSGIRRHLAILAAEYGQDAIALTVGGVEFVGPDPTYRVIGSE